MKYENSYQALTFETMLKTIVKKTIKKNYNNYSDEIKDEIDLDNIFGSLFPKFDLNSEDFQKELGEVINPISKNGEFVKIIEPASYFSLFIEYMVHNTFSETQDSSSVSFKKHYEDILTAMCQQVSFLDKYPCVKSFFEISLQNDNRTKNLINILVNGDYEQGQRIYKKGKFSEKEFIEQKKLINLFINDMDNLVKVIFQNKIEQLITFNYYYNYYFNINKESKIYTSYGLKKIDMKEIEFYSNLFLNEIDKTLERVVSSIPEGLRNKFVNKVNLFMNKEIQKRIRNNFNNWENVEYFIQTTNSIFNKYRSEKVKFKINKSVFSKLPSLNGLEYNKDIMNISCIGGAEATQSLIKNIIECINMMAHERILFKSIRIKDNKENLQILFNFKEEIPRNEKENLLSSLEDMILSTLKDRNDGGEWFIKSSDRVKYSFSIDELSRKFLDLNSEAFLRVKLSNVKKDDVERRVKKKL